MALKISDEHMAVLRKYVAPLYDGKTRGYYADIGLNETRYRWDMFWLAKNRHREVLTKMMDEFYCYANDTHLESALKKLELESREVRG